MNFWRVILPLLLWSAAALAASPPARYLIPLGPPQELISQAQREEIGLHNGPDSILDLWQDGSRTYLVFSGASRQGGHMEGGQTFRLAVDPTLSHIIPPLQSIQRAACRMGPRQNPQSCNRFDSDYAGAGTMVQCSNAAVYIYHGENHTSPDGQFMKKQGWTGVGQAHWDAGAERLVSDGQIAGLNASHLWESGADGAQTRQTPAASGNPSVIADPTGTYFYMYFGNRAGDLRAAGIDLPCDKRTCWSVARTPKADFCAAAAAGRKAAWQVLHQGRFDSPALLPDGTGGSFTPVFDHSAGVDNVANVTALPAQHIYVMTSILRGRTAPVVERVSTDGLTWSAPITLVEGPPAGMILAYPRILQSADGFVLTYVLRSEDDGWRNASVIRQSLRLSGR